MPTDLESPRRHVAPDPHRPSAAADRASGPRQTQKEATRNRVLEAARELFDSQGYQGTTIREIARHAGVSVGSVFTTFASKGEILSQVMEERLDRLYAELDRVVPHLRGSTADRLRSMFAIHFAFEARRTRLFLSHIAAAYDWTLPSSTKPFGRTQRLRDMISDLLAQGVADGEVDPAADLQAMVELLIAAYGWTYHLVVTDGADVKVMTAAMDRQIGLIADGFRPRSS
ncbi:MAG: transcriptional regulator, TetR family [Phenylobacterium sp.]|nr:transcriptional regulator, TetR family [Phenylobacterium sp.]